MAKFIPPGYDPKKDAVILADYDSNWSKLAMLEIEQLRALLPAEHIVDIQHVGSTAIPGMAAKPVIDIEIATKSLSLLKPIAIAALESMGYVFWHGNPDKERLFFVKGMPPFGEQRTHHIHIVEPTSRHWEEKILFRDYLIKHPEVTQEYQTLKIKLAEQYKYNREKYTETKSDFIKRILELAKNEKSAKS